MKEFTICIIIIKLLIPGFLIIPLWNFQNSTIDLLSSNNTFTKKIYDKTLEGKEFKITKTIMKMENGSRIETNTLNINNDEYEKDTIWEDIESVNSLNNDIYVCPRGKNYMNKYNIGENFEEITSSSFGNQEEWDLKCYYQFNENHFFISFLNGDYKIYFSKNNDFDNWYSNSATKMYDGFFDFKWTTKKTGTGNNEYELSISSQIVSFSYSPLFIFNVFFSVIKPFSFFIVFVILKIFP